MTALRKPSTWLALAATGLVAAFLLLIAPNYRLYLIHTGSMTPTIPIGSAVIDRKGSDVKVGEVITFHRPVDGAIVTHRLIKILPDGTYVTKGDDNPTPDLGSIPRSAIVGHVVSAPRYVGEWIHFMSRTTLGYLFDACILIGLWFAATEWQEQKALTPPPGRLPSGEPCPARVAAPSAGRRTHHSPGPPRPVRPRLNVPAAA